MKAALIQLRLCDSEISADRWMRVEQLLEGLAEQSIDLIVLPELWGVGFPNYGRYADEEEPLRGTTVSRLAVWAQRLHCHIVTGSFIERAPDGRRYNTTTVLDANGYLLGGYRKIHLFGYQSHEKKLLTAGVQTSEVFTPYGVVGLATCYDLRFPEQFRRMVDNGASIFAVTAAWPQERLEDWRLLCRVRALENQCFVLACNHAGLCGGSIGAGHSMAVAPNGTILAEADAYEQVLIVHLDANDVQRERSRFPVLHDCVPIK